MPETNVRIAAGDVLGWESFPTQGHASHHVSYLARRHAATPATRPACGFCPGRVRPAGLRRRPTSTSRPGTRRLAAIRSRSPERLALIHFGVHDDVEAHLDRLDTELDRWAARVRDGMSQEEFVEAALADAGADAESYDRVAPFWQSWHGMKRYWETRAET